MKKRIGFFAVLLFCAGLLSACGKKDEDKNTYLKDFKAGDYVELGEYMGIEVALAEPDITQEQVEEYIEYLISLGGVTKEVTDRSVETGDIVNLDFEGKVDGVAFDGGTAQGYDLIIGSGNFIPGFEDGMIGMEIGETRDIDLVFPEEYQSEELAGQPAVFTVTVNSITVDLDELNEEYIQALRMEGITSVEGYKEYIYDELYAEAMYYYEESKMNEVAAAVSENSSFKELPENLVSRMVQTLTNNITMYASLYSMDVETYLLYSGMMNADTVEESLYNRAYETAENYVMLQAIADLENLNVSEEELNNELGHEAEASGYQSVEEYEAAIDKEAFREYLMTRSVLDKLVENAVFKSE